MKALGIIILLCVSVRAAEVWLTPERAAQLKRVAKRTYITQRREIGGGLEEVTWSNGNSEWVTTQAVARVAGAKAAHGWQAKVDAEKELRKALLADVKALTEKGNASRKDLEAVVEKAEKAEKEKGYTK